MFPRIIAGAAGDERRDAALRNLEVGEQVLEREVAEVVEFVLGHLADAVVRGDPVENQARLAQGVGDGAVEVENQCFVNHRRLHFKPQAKDLDQRQIRMDVVVQRRALAGEMAQQGGEGDHRRVVRAENRRGDAEFQSVLGRRPVGKRRAGPG